MSTRDYIKVPQSSRSFLSPWPFLLASWLNLLFFVFVLSSFVCLFSSFCCVFHSFSSASFFFLYSFSCITSPAVLVSNRARGRLLSGADGVEAGGSTNMLEKNSFLLTWLDRTEGDLGDGLVDSQLELEREGVTVLRQVPDVRGVGGVTAEIIQKETTVVPMRSVVNQRLSHA